MRSCDEDAGHRGDAQRTWTPSLSHQALHTGLSSLIQMRNHYSGKLNGLPDKAGVTLASFSSCYTSSSSSRQLYTLYKCKVLGRLGVQGCLNFAFFLVASGCAALWIGLAKKFIFPQHLMEKHSANKGSWLVSSELAFPCGSPWLVPLQELFWYLNTWIFKNTVKPF